jgi:hypothetical protein
MKFFSFLLAVFEPRSAVSSVRFYAFISLLVGSALAFVGMFRNEDLYALATLCSVFIGGAFGGSVWHKFAEKKAGKK